MLDTIINVFVGGFVRLILGLISASPTFLVGILIAAIMRYYLGDKGTKRLFGGETLRSLPQSWLIGMFLPVCSIGVLPVLREMKRAGLKPGAMTAFALAAPLFNPFSLLYGLTLSRPLVIASYAIGSLFVVTALGMIWDRGGQSKSGSESESEQESPEDRLIGGRRLAATFLYFARETTSTSLVLALIAAVGLFVLAVAIPFGSLQHLAERDDWWAPLKMIIVAVPAYATPMLAMGQLGMMFQHANSPGAAFVLLILGTGLNLATPIWFARNFGAKRTLQWFLGLTLITTGIAYAINRPLFPKGVEPAGHTHAFDVYSNPFASNYQLNFTLVQDVFDKGLDLGAVIAFATLVIVGIVGVVFRACKMDHNWLMKNAPAQSLASSLEGPKSDKGRGWDIVVPPEALGFCLLFGLVGFSIVSCYAYYPDPQECLEQFASAESECLPRINERQVDGAVYWIPIMEDWSRKTEVGTLIRYGEVRPYQKMQGFLLRKKLEELEHELQHDPFEKEVADELVRDFLKTQIRWANTFRPKTE